MIKYLIKSIRPRQWYKNSLLFVGIVFSANILNASMWATVLLSFVFFCLLSSAEYLINDIADRERDKIHPLKRLRPIASGKLKMAHAIVVSFLLIAVSLAGVYFTINLNFLAISIGYMVLILIYSFVLKRLVIADVLVISLGFVIRAVAGCLAIGVAISQWLVICTFLLALFLALIKRWHELVTLAENSDSHRSSLSGYTPEVLEHFIDITSGALLVSYILYTSAIGGVAMITTGVFVAYGLFRYLYLVLRGTARVEPEEVFKDKALLADLAIWALAVFLIMLHRTLQ